MAFLDLELASGSTPGPTHRSYWVVEGRFAAGAYPGKAGRGDLEHVPDVIAELLSVGIDCFINLTEDEPGGGDSHLTRYDADVSASAIIDRHPIVDVSIPAVDQLARILDATARKLDLPAGKVIVTVDQHANTSAASVPLALDTAVRDGRIRQNDLIVLEAMGGGFTWGAAVIRF